MAQGFTLHQGAEEPPWLQSGGELVTQRNGLVTGRLAWKVPVGDWRSMPKVADSHPLAWFVTVEKRTVVFGKGFWIAHCEYAGVETDVAEPVFDFNPATGTDPVETSNRFVTKIGGKPSAPKNGAIFVDFESGVETNDDARGVFDRFKLIIDGEKNPFAGMEEIITANNTTWTKSWAQRTKPTGGNKPVRIGTPEGEYPEFPEGYNWLEFPTAYSKRGSAYDCRKVWLLSGENGWREEAYGDES